MKIGFQAPRFGLTHTIQYQTRDQATAAKAVLEKHYANYQNPNEPPGTVTQEYRTLNIEVPNYVRVGSNGRINLFPAVADVGARQIVRNLRIKPTAYAVKAEFPVTMKLAMTDRMFHLPGQGIDNLLQDTRPKDVAGLVRIVG